MRLRLSGIELRIEVEFRRRQFGSRQAELNRSTGWRRRWQRLRCWLGLHYWDGWSLEYTKRRRFRMCQRWAPECMTTQWRDL